MKFSIYTICSYSGSDSVCKYCKGWCKSYVSMKFKKDFCNNKGGIEIGEIPEYDELKKKSYIDIRNKKIIGLLLEYRLGL